jgi:hypothetical protein
MNCTFSVVLFWTRRWDGGLLNSPALLLSAAERGVKDESNSNRRVKDETNRRVNYGTKRGAANRCQVGTTDPKYTHKHALTQVKRITTPRNPMLHEHAHVYIFTFVVCSSRQHAHIHLQTS